MNDTTDPDNTTADERDANAGVETSDPETTSEAEADQREETLQPGGKRVTTRTVNRHTTHETIDEVVEEDVALWTPVPSSAYPRPVG